jgi:phosphatidylinositol alpha-1,6-mannosyltransferase
MMGGRLPDRLILLTHEFPPFRGGVATFCDRIATAAGLLRTKVTVLAPRYGRADPAVGHAMNVSFAYFDGGEFQNWQFLHVLWLTFRQLLRHRGAHFFAADWPFVAACGLLNRFIPFRYSAMLHGSEILFFRKSRLLNILTLGNPFFGASRFCTNSQFTADLLLQNYPQIPRPRLTIAHLGVDEFWFSETDEAQNVVLQRLGIPQGKQIVLSVGRLHPRKGQTRCIMALSKLEPALRRDLAYVIVGSAVDAEYAEELKRSAESVDFPVTLTGGISDIDLRVLYRSSSVFCLPSQTHDTKVEGFGLVFLEAAGSGLPSVAVRAGAVPEVIRHGDTGLLVPPDDEPALTAALSSILEHPETRDRMGRAARDWAQTFTWARCAMAALSSSS